MRSARGTAHGDWNGEMASTVERRHKLHELASSAVLYRCTYIKARNALDLRAWLSDCLTEALSTMLRGVVLRKLLVGLTGFTGPLHCTTFDFMFRFWKFCSELRLFYILIL